MRKGAGLSVSMMIPRSAAPCEDRRFEGYHCAKGLAVTAEREHEGVAIDDAGRR
jgi:hypothetical protein